MSLTVRCPWVSLSDQAYIKYHDHEWGVPVFDDTVLYEFLVLESFQAGLSWRTILSKRARFKKVFSGFDPGKVAKFSDNKVRDLLGDKEIIRNKAKIESAINNAKQFVKIQKEFGSFSKYLWSWVGDKPILNRYKSIKEYPKFTTEAVLLSKDLAKRGMRFMGPVTIYSLMQAVGLVNDHVTSCYRYEEIKSSKN